MSITDNLFTEERAMELQGERVRTNREFSGIPEGTVGTVTDYDTDDSRVRAGKEEVATIGVEWTTENGNTITDWFDKQEFDDYLEVV